ncbi:MAG: hypothetical protein IJ006_00285, partial [Lachnospiraceae bacterium]|nr:hypothetical protein [Lachnospiraceae bacterium]
SVQAGASHLAPNFATLSLSRGRVRIIREFRKQVSKLSCLLTLPARMLTKKTKYIQYLLWNMMVFYDKM